MIYEYQCTGCKQNFSYDSNYDGFSCAACGRKLIRKDRPTSLGLKIINKVISMKKSLFGFLKNVSFVIPIFMLTACSMVPNLLQTAEDVIDDDAVKIIISREAITRNTNLKATVELDNAQLKQFKE